MTCYGEKKYSYLMCYLFMPRLHERKDNFPLNSVEIMTKKLILVAKEAQQQIGATSCLWLKRY